jgi:glycosyltransferase involved in cell wall biosynthesis
MSKKNVLIVLQYLQPGGIEWMVARQTQFMHDQQRKWKPFVFVYDNSAVPPIDSFFNEHRIPLVRWNKPKGFSWKLVGKLILFCRREKISVIHVHHLGGLIYAVFAKWFGFLPVSIVFTQHSFLDRAAHARYAYMEKFFCWFADELTAVSPQVQKQFKDYSVTRRKVQVIPNGSVFPSVNMTSLEEVGALRAELLKHEKWMHIRDISGQMELSAILEERWVLYLGRLHRGKGQDLFLQVWDLLSSQTKKNSSLIFMGPPLDAEFVERLKMLIQKLSIPQNIFILPATKNAMEWMRLSQVFVSSSESEGWPIAPLEALGSGVDCLLSDIEGHKMYEGYAQFYDLKRPDQGAAILEKILNEQMSASQFAAHRQATWLKSEELRERYSVEQMVDRYESCYDTLL